jgi:hypothetical protein
MCLNINILAKKPGLSIPSTVRMVLEPMFPDDLYDHELLSYPYLGHLAYLKLAPPLHSF